MQKLGFVSVIFKSRERQTTAGQQSVPVQTVKGKEDILCSN